MSIRDKKGEFITLAITLAVSLPLLFGGMEPIVGSYTVQQRVSSVFSIASQQHGIAQARQPTQEFCDNHSPFKLQGAFFNCTIVSALEDDSTVLLTSTRGYQTETEALAAKGHLLKQDLANQHSIAFIETPLARVKIERAPKKPVITGSLGGS